MNTKNKKIVDILEQVNATDIKIYNFENKSPFYDYVILATASDRQANAAVGYFKKENIIGLNNVEGRNNTGWVLADAGDVIVHMFTEDNRKKYGFDDRLMDLKQITL